MEEKGRGRPSVVSKARAAARQAGEQMVLASVRQMNEAVERLAEDRVQKLKAGCRGSCLPQAVKGL